MKKRERRKAMEAMDPVVKKIINKEIERVMVEVRALQSELNEVTQRLPAVNASIMSLLEKSHKLDKLSFALISRAGLKSGIGEETVITRIGDKVVTAGEIGHRVGALSESYDQTFERLKDEIRLFEEACVRVPREMARITNDSGRRLHDEFERITLPEGQGLEGPMEMGDVDEDTGEWKI